jgi:hypothetical protein
MNPTLPAVSGSALRAFARRVIPESVLASPATLSLGRRLFMLAYLVDPPEFAADGCFRFGNERDEDVLEQLLRRPSTVDAEWAVTLRAGVLREPMPRLVAGLRFLRGVLATRCARIGAIRYLDVVRPSRFSSNERRLRREVSPAPSYLPKSA